MSKRPTRRQGIIACECCGRDFNMDDGLDCTHCGYDNSISDRRVSSKYEPRLGDDPNNTVPDLSQDDDSATYVESDVR